MKKRTLLPVLMGTFLILATACKHDPGQTPVTLSPAPTPDTDITSAIAPTPVLTAALTPTPTEPPVPSPTPIPTLFPTAALPTPTPLSNLEPDCTLYNTEPSELSPAVRLTDFDAAVTCLTLTRENRLVGLYCPSQFGDTASAASQNPTIEELNLESGQFTSVTLDASQFGKASAAGKKPGATAFDYGYRLFDIDSHWLLVSDYHGAVILLNRDYSVADICTPPASFYRYSIPDNRGGCYLWELSGDFVTYVSVADGKLQLQNIPLTLPAEYSLTGISSYADPGYLVLNVTETYTIPHTTTTVYTTCKLIYNLATGKYSSFPSEGVDETHYYKDSLLRFTAKNGVLNLRKSSTPNLNTTINCPENMTLGFVSEIEETAFLYSADTVYHNLRLYGVRPDTGAVRFDTTIPFPSHFYPPQGIQILGHTLFLSVPNMYGNGGVYCLNVSDAADQSGYENLVIAGDSMSSNNLLRAQMQAKYNVHIHIREDAISHNTDYYFLPELNEQTIRQALLTLDEVLSSFPEDFFRELVQKSNFTYLDFHFTARIKSAQVSSDTVDIASGLTTVSDSRRSIYLNINETSLKETIYHELMHVIENVVSYNMLSNRSLVGFSHYDALNPAGFRYANSYLNYTRTPYACYEPYGGAETYFVDAYSTTYMSEDLARVFQKLCTNTKETLPEYFSTQPIYWKADYICAALRETFSTIAKSGPMPWEAVLPENHPMSYYIDNYRNQMH